MQIESGTRLGPYEIVERVGAGGMGEVYRARDTRLSRSVAIKVLPAEFASDPRLRLRFEREAQTISSLNHPNICTLHDVGRENGLEYLVLEYCEGTTLADRLDRGALPVEQVLRYGIEIAEALSRAHHAGIVHRDLKPSNIMITKAGIKLLDFGLAKQRVPSQGADTASLDGTLAGTIQYMAPEVLAGKEADSRSDIFSFGVVLYEMVTGRPAFPGTSHAAIIAAVLEHEPQPVREARPSVPALLEQIIQRCLQKDPEQRWESARDIAGQLRWIGDARTSPERPPRRAAIAVGGSILLALLAVAATRWTIERRQPSEAVVRLAIPLLETPMEIRQVVGANIAISPDGKRVAFVATRAIRGGKPYLHVRQLDSFETVVLEGTEQARYPVFSPDGQWIVYFSPGGLRKISVSDGQAQTLTKPAGGPGGLSWSTDGRIYFSRGFSGGLGRISAAGGEPEWLTEPDPAAGENSHRWPQVLPDGKHVLFTIRTQHIASFDQARLAVLSLETRKWKVVLEGGTYGRYLAPGHLVFARGGDLYAAPFDLQSLSVRGPARKVLNDVLTIPQSGAAHYSVSDGGNVVYGPGRDKEARTELLAVKRSGESRVLATLNFAGSRPRVSPDGRKVAFNVFAANDDIWIYDIASGIAARATNDPGDETIAIWAPDSARFLYTGAGGSLMIRRADNSGEAEEILPAKAYVTSCSADGRFAAVTMTDPVTGSDIWLVPLDGDRKPRPFLRTRFDEALPDFSPDSRWILYISDESEPGRDEVYVRHASGTGGRWQVSTDGCGDGFPRWSRDGREIFCGKGNDVYAVPIAIVDGEPRAGKPELAFSYPPGGGQFDEMTDGFLIAHPARLERPQQINVILNWTSELPR